MSQEVEAEEEPKLDEALKKASEQGEIITVKPPITCSKTEHSFRLVRNEMGIAAECVKCPVGYPLPPIGWELKEGHIYIHGQLVI